MPAPEPILSARSSAVAIGLPKRTSASDMIYPLNFVVCRTNMLPSTAASTASGMSGTCCEHIHAALNRNLCSVQIGIVGVYQLAASVSDIFGSSGNGFPVSTDVAFQLI